MVWLWYTYLLFIENIRSWNNYYYYKFRTRYTEIPNIIESQCSIAFQLLLLFVGWLGWNDEPEPGQMWAQKVSNIKMTFLCYYCFYQLAIFIDSFSSAKCHSLKYEHFQYSKQELHFSRHDKDESNHKWQTVTDLLIVPLIYQRLPYVRLYTLLKQKKKIIEAA